MAEAMYALDAVARVHGFAFDQVHAPFGGVALARLGQTVPASTRDAVLGADAVLVAGAEEPTLDDVDGRARLAGESDPRALRPARRRRVRHIGERRRGRVDRSARIRDRGGAPHAARLRRRQRVVRARPDRRARPRARAGRARVAAGRDAVRRFQPGALRRRRRRTGMGGGHGGDRRRSALRTASPRMRCSPSTGRACSFRRPTEGSRSPATAS